MSRAPSASGPLAGRRVLLIVGGGIAAYKALDLIRRLRDRGAAVRPLLTESAQEFITPLAAAALAGERTHTDLFDRESEAEIGHIRLARDADAVVVAPATANMMARMATGHAPDLAATVLLATTLPILIAPAMNVRMWLHPATRRNLATLKADGVAVVGPNEGAMAEAEFGPGRLAEPHEIADALEAMLAARSEGSGFGFLAGREVPKKPLAGRHVLVTSGPTHEAIDPVRYLANRSSGRQGHAVAAAAAEAGARVTLVSGPVAIPDPAGVTVVRVESARAMLAAVEAALPADLAIFAAAVGDWRPAEARSAKIKKDGSTPAPLTLVENPDILATISARTEGRPPLVVGFAAETDQVLDNARKKIARKGCDLIVANDVSAEGGVMGGLDNTVHLVARDGGVETWPKLGKDEVGRRLVARFSELLATRSV
ncbi:bifunctional phosphopantothenoylcysteine decarboxylase/phosphopantothenate synthase [Methylobacterium sp. Leaf456]|uniref:bifunctional phosphopantothenoylcysteine decarboxylase/phosphopantothenate--cysteine ligase CoaBC n=1 Tax=Methylobacterium sp. Leaf456 TaxID=1736382 RepID=UPI0006F92E8A|nr:bifunctional phosphopantothenoylcysteine decarboxylase/phosphopantothenate--cysteine ligase CoaBC [Methylobacterium sp. Leaf456]KQT61493.1 bifunctional phosphopantothenoylcysteine decarboxylase/phosphopantothenate synthase [Methylobacterium sp. Leaf456]